MAGYEFTPDVRLALARSREHAAQALTFTAGVREEAVWQAIRDVR